MTALLNFNVLLQPLIYYPKSLYIINGCDNQNSLLITIWINLLQAPVLFQGIDHSLNPANTLVRSPSAYSANPKTKLGNPPSLTGSAISLVSIQHVCWHSNIHIMSIKIFSNALM
jgi:hypothetical protein